MDIQIVLQHVFGFIGICTVINWIYELVFKYAAKANSPIQSYKGKCTFCGCTVLSSLRSLNIKKCTSCGHEMKWNLDPGQMPLVRSNRMVKRNEK